MNQEDLANTLLTLSNVTTLAREKCGTTDDAANKLFAAVEQAERRLRREVAHASETKFRAFVKAAHPELLATYDAQLLAPETPLEPPPVPRGPAEFELFVRQELGDVAVYDGCRYISPKIHNYYKTWNAARETVATGAPQKESTCLRAPLQPSSSRGGQIPRQPY